jgi:arginyl-tRNA synthetase
LAGLFHAQWNVGNDRPERRFLIPDNAPLTCARLFLADAIGQIIRNGLGIMGVEAVQEMS